MKLMRCPLNGWRGVAEFMYGGVVEEIPDPDTCDDRTWSEYLFIRENRQGPVAEWWCHLPSAFWFIALRHTATGEVLDTCTVAEWRARQAAPLAGPVKAAQEDVQGSRNG
jgi:sarcosine oxidase subunit delta